MGALEMIDSLAGGRVLVVGSLPPAARDLDLLVRGSAAAEIGAGLSEAGFERHGATWARFHDCRADVVDIANAEAWALPSVERSALFDEAEPIGPAGNVCRPNPPHALLIIARRIMREGPRLREGRRRRVATELQRDPEAFAAARARAGAWGARRALGALERAYAQDSRLSFTLRRRALFEEFRRARAPGAAWIGAWRAVLARPRRGRILTVAVAGANDTGAHAERLAATLERLGYRVLLAQASATRRSVWRELTRGGVIVCERTATVLPPAVGGGLVRLFAPMPTTYLIGSSLPANPGDHHVRRISATDAEDRLCAELARAVWGDLAARED